VLRAWDWDKPLLLAPAMNTAMWAHPAAAAHVAAVSSFGASVIDPVVKALACGDVGVGGLPPPAALAGAVRGALGLGR
jgi:phosphopantothenoylcysteine decarboxylase